MGRLEGQFQEEPAEDVSGLVDESKPLLPQVPLACGAAGGALHGTVAQQAWPAAWALPAAFGAGEGTAAALPLPAGCRLPAAQRSSGAIAARCRPPLPQVIQLSPQQYLQWVSFPSTGHPTMFASPLVERLTCTEW